MSCEAVTVAAVAVFFCKQKYGPNTGAGSAKIQGGFCSQEQYTMTAKKCIPNFLPLPHHICSEFFRI